MKEPCDIVHFLTKKLAIRHLNRYICEKQCYYNIIYGKNSITLDYVFLYS